MSSKEIIEELGRMRQEELREVYEYLGRRPDVVGGSTSADEYIGHMNAILGEDIRCRRRDRNVSWGRFMVAYVLLGDGWTTSAVGSVFRMDHSSIVHAKKAVQNMLDHPFVFKAEMNTWRKFKKRIENGRMRLECEQGRQAV